MQIGWIDFSKNERNKVLNVINLLEEQGAVDELGIGTVRDAFAEYFFPGTSTVQTRAKYFLIVPYLLKEAGEGKFGDNINEIMRKIDDEERNCRDIMIGINDEGVIGRLNPSSWVLRPPSNIYWNGIKKLGIFIEDSLQIRQYISQSISQLKRKQLKKYGNRKDDAEENEKDDIDAGDVTLFHFWNLGNIYNKKWRDSLSIDLTRNEAVYLKNQVLTYQHDTLFAYILKNNISLNKYNSFEDFCAEMELIIEDSKLRKMMKLANDFNDFLSVITTRYNLIVSNFKGEIAIDRWKNKTNSINDLCKVDLNDIFENLHIRRGDLYRFLNSIKKELLNNNFDNVDKLIISREKNIKGVSRAKTCNVSKNYYVGWIGAYTYDYRFTPTKRIINDIMKSEAMQDV